MLRYKLQLFRARLRCALLVLRGRAVVYGCNVPGSSYYVTTSHATSTNVDATVTWGNCKFS